MTAAGLSSMRVVWMISCGLAAGPAPGDSSVVSTTSTAPLPAATVLDPLTTVAVAVPRPLTVPFAAPAVVRRDTATRPRQAASAPSLTLAAVIARVDLHYPKLLGLDAERQQATARRIVSSGAFDVTLRAGSTYDEYNKEGKRADFATQSAGFEVPFRTGPTLFAGAAVNDGLVKSPLSDTGSDGFFNVGLRVPLLKGFGVNPRAADERKALLGEPKADFDYADARIEILYGAALQYWSWVAAERRWAIAEELVGVARDRSVQVKQEAEAGARQAIDGFEADAEVERRVEAAEKARRDFEKDAIKLAVYLWEPDGPAGDIPIRARVPAAPSVPTPLPPGAVISAKATAMVRRPELHSIDQALGQVGVDQELARNDMLPSLDALVNPGTDRGSGSVGPQAKYALSFSVPLQRRAARGKLTEAELKATKLLEEARLARRKVEAEVDDAASAIAATVRRAAAAGRELEATRALLTGEIERLRLGEGTLFLVNQRERAVAEARVKIVNIHAEYEIARAALTAVTAAY